MSFAGEFRDKVVLFTGGASGIGAAISRVFAALGARLAVHYHGTKADEVEELATEVREAGGEILTLQAISTMPRRSKPASMPRPGTTTVSISWSTTPGI